MTLAIIIDTKNRDIYYRRDINKLEDLKREVSGLITTGFYNEHNDVCYVNDEGLFDETFDFFTYEGAHQPFAGNGVLIGTDDKGSDADVVEELESVKKKVKFHDRDMIRKEFL